MASRGGNVPRGLHQSGIALLEHKDGTVELLRRSMPKLDHSNLIPEGARSLRV